MSKTSAGNWITTAARACSKRCAASAIAFTHKYRDDFFFRTQANIVALQALYASLILALSIGALAILYHEVVTGVVSAIATALTSKAPLSPESIALALEAARTREIAGIAGLIAIATGVFGYLVSRFALAPAKNALTAQKQFIGNIAHELRTPLAIIKTNTEVRLLDTDLPKAAREVHSSNLEELDRISDIINNLLTLNALVRPERIPFQAVDLAKVAHRVVGKLGSLARKKPVHMRVRALSERMAWGNPTALEQIAMNIVKNAVTYTAKGDIVITVGPAGDHAVELSVRDPGKGIARSDLARIFEPFYRGDRARSREGGGGSGLGLAIVNELVKMHHGRISIRSAPGKGTTVSVVLPRLPREERQVARGREASMSEVRTDFSRGMTFARDRPFYAAR